MQLSFRHCRQGVKKRRFDLALVLLASAVDEGHSMLLLSSVTASSGELVAVVRDMLADGLIEEVRVTDTMHAWRVDGEVRYGLRVSQRGLRSVGYPPLRSCVASA